MADTSQFEGLSNLDIVQRCLHPDRQLVGGHPYGNLVVKLSEDTVVKFGLGVFAEEAANQRKAFELLDSNIVRVPKLYHYFTWAENDTMPVRGFIIMEFVRGQVLESVDSHQTGQIVKILSYFSTIQSQCPGPLQTGVSRGLLWEENGEPTFKSVNQMERWLNFRLPDVESKLALEEYPLVLCHLDLALRNIIWLEDGTACLIDWASAGFYPRFFEVCLLKVMGSNLTERIEKLSKEEEAQMLLLERSFYNGIKYSFRSIQGCLE